MICEPGTDTFTKEEMGSRYIQVTVRTLVNPNDPADVDEMRKAQDAVQVILSDPGRFEVPDRDQASLCRATSMSFRAEFCDFCCCLKRTDGKRTGGFATGRCSPPTAFDRA